MHRVEPLSAIFDVRVFTAIGVYAILAAIELPFEFWLVRILDDNPPAQWFAERLGAPLLRAACVVVFVYLAYPALFGLREAPTLATLLAARTAGMSTLLGAALLVALFAPVVPGLHRHPEFVLPIQGMLATALLFNWLTDWLHMTSVSAWPGGDVMLLACVCAWAMHRLARRLGEALGNALDVTSGTSGYDKLAVHLVTMVAQLPVILIFSRGLALQIAM